MILDPALVTPLFTRNAQLPCFGAWKIAGSTRSTCGLCFKQPKAPEMKESYLQVTFRHGRPLAAYLYLPREADEKSVRTSRVEPGMGVDFSRSGKPIGIELTAPGEVTLSALNQLLEELGQQPLRDADLEPLRAA